MFSSTSVVLSTRNLRTVYYILNMIFDVQWLILIYNIFGILFEEINNLIFINKSYKIIGIDFK